MGSLTEIEPTDEAHAKYTRVLYLQQITLLAAILSSPNHRAVYLELSFQYLYRVHWIELGG
jgi:hypothetical protein